MSFQFNPLNNSFDVVQNAIEQDNERTFYFKNIAISGDALPTPTLQYTVLSNNPVDAYGNNFSTPPNTTSYISMIGVLIKNKNATTVTTSPVFRVMRQGVTPTGSKK